MIQKDKIMIYGANGYTAKLILEEFIKRGTKPVLAGRNNMFIKKIAEENKCDFRIFDLSDLEVIINNLNDVHTLLNCAGPFTETAFMMIDACLVSGVNYLDITGEMEVFEYAWKNNLNAEKKSINIMPGVGFDVIPTDCLAKKLKEEMPDAVKLKLGFAPKSSMASRGTIKSVITHISKNVVIRRNGELEFVKIGKKVNKINFGDFNSTAMAIQWADVFNAYYSTGIPNIEAYLAVPKLLIFLVRNLINILTSDLLKSILMKFANTYINGPDKLAREKSFSYIWGSVEDKNGKVIEHVYLFPDGYSLTAVGAVECTFRVFNGGVKSGTQTPSLAFGSNFMDQFVLRKIK